MPVPAGAAQLGELERPPRALPPGAMQHLIEALGALGTLQLRLDPGGTWAAELITSRGSCKISAGTLFGVLQALLELARAS